MLVRSSGRWVAAGGILVMVLAGCASNPSTSNTSADDTVSEAPPSAATSNGIVWPSGASEYADDLCEQIREYAELSAYANENPKDQAASMESIEMGNVVLAEIFDLDSNFEQGVLSQAEYDQIQKCRKKLGKIIYP